MVIVIVTVIVTIMTRLAGVLDYDRALIVGEGKVLEDGSPKELLARPMGFFSALYRYHDRDGDEEDDDDDNMIHSFLKAREEKQLKKEKDTRQACSSQFLSKSTKTTANTERHI